LERSLQKQQVEDIIRGATLLGAGGGGSAKTGYLMVEEIKDVVVVDPADVSDESMVVVVAGMGSPVVLLKEGWRGEEVPALERMEKILCKKIDYIVPVETGGFNSISPLHAGAIKGLPVIDGDGAGRAIPELEQTTFNLGGVPVEPICLADSKGNSCALYSKDAKMGEDMARAITTIFGMTAGIVCYPMTGKQLKETVIPGTLSTAEAVGKAIREAKEVGKDVVEAALKAMDGVLLVKGKVAKKTEEVKSGFDYGRIYVGDVIVDYKNENMIAWKNNQPLVTVPDSICWLRIDGEPLTNADIGEGMEVAVIGKRAHPKWIALNGFKLVKHVLESIGYTGGYVPLKQF
jgi:DUF917 family protein